jgi:hypothetical protein
MRVRWPRSFFQQLIYLKYLRAGAFFFLEHKKNFFQVLLRLSVAAPFLRASGS